MTITQIIGAVLIAIPFVAIYAAVASEGGWRLALGVFLASFVLTAFVCLGAVLLVGWS